jgi:hypothetical protein
MRDLYSYSLSPQQFAASARRNSARSGERMHTRPLVDIAGVLFLLAVAAMAANPVSDGRLLGSVGISMGAMAAFAVVCACLALFARHSGLQLLVRRSTFAPGPWKIGVDDDGLWLEGPHGESFTRWSGWKAVEEHGELVLLYHDDVTAHPVPFAAFESAEERREFIAHVRARIAAQPGEMRPSSAAGPHAARSAGQPEAQPINFAPNFRTLLETAARIVMLRPVVKSQLDVTWVQILGLVLASLVPPIAFSLATVGAEGYLAWDFLPAVLFHVPMLLVAMIVVAHLIGRTAYVSALLAGALLAWTLIDFFSLGAWLVVQEWAGDNVAVNMAFYYAPIAWLTIAMVRLALSLVPAPGPRAAWVLAAGVIFVALPLGGVHRERSLWSFDYERQAAKGNGQSRPVAATSEDVFYRQPELLHEELEAVKPGRKGIVDVFLVGVAGYGNQDVFMREVDAVATLFRERFDANGHIVQLVNNPKTMRRYPVASATSIEASLKRVAEAMNGDEDVLVLFLTSHGSNDHRFTVQLWPLELKQITPQMLREMLDQSGIRNRVVIVSACYSGGFVRELQDENTLVIAAAAPDRNSFGCTNEADWTYFGKGVLRRGAAADDLVHARLRDRHAAHRGAGEEGQVRAVAAADLARHGDQGEARGAGAAIGPRTSAAGSGVRG